MRPIINLDLFSREYVAEIKRSVSQAEEKLKNFDFKKKVSEEVQILSKHPYAASLKKEQIRELASFNASISESQLVQNYDFRL